MNQKEIEDLIEFLVEKEIVEFELERGDVKVRVRRTAADMHGALPEMRYVAMPPVPAPTAVPGPAAAPAPAALAPSDAAEETGLHIIRSPIVGTFYEGPAPGAPPFVKVGDTVSTGQVLCIIEAMKLMNEIESDYAGEIVKKYVANAQPIEYGQPLFAIRPK